MSEDKKKDEETKKFYEENKEMIDRIIAQKTELEDPYLVEAIRRAAFERKMRLEYEAEKARREILAKAQKEAGSHVTVERKVRNISVWINEPIDE